MFIGETCDMHYKQKTGYLIGEDITRPGSWIGRAMRDMCNPRDICKSLYTNIPCQ